MKNGIDSINLNISQKETNFVVTEYAHLLDKGLVFDYK